MAGSISLSLSQQFDSLGKPLNGGRLETFAAGTTTRQSAYQDSALTLPWPNPLTLDSAGRIPQLYFADGFIKIRLTDRNGVPQISADSILVVGPSSGSGGGSSVDQNALLSTGDLKYRYATGTLAGWVRLNGRTIGSSTSGATERANADCEPLFLFLYGVDSTLAVTGGRTGNAAADWAANKAIALPDARGRVFAGLDDMGNSSAGLLAGLMSPNSITLGAIGGVESVAITALQLPAHSHPNTLTDPGHAHSITSMNVTSVQNGTGANQGNLLVTTSASPATVNTNSAVTGISITNASTGNGDAHPNLQPTLQVTAYIRL